MISENKENVRKSHKLDDDGGGVDGGVRSIGIVFIYSYVYCHRIFKAKICATVLFGCVLQSRTKSHPGFTNIFHFIVLVVVIGLFIMEVKKITKLCCQRLKSLKYSNISFGEWIFTGR
ncbi:uncharacterized protein OCT59_028707 [Rhizophagus irregularis]|uniref:uncharacterized protein n=1 Tax=Rhizophagus irregularis TaxID=588596 RepID=UPI0019F8F0F2|nr:hypothetical protein OCT59_028707 [Rhizophagus irregularis]GET50854.1 hypothetical protein GLOIN_2v1869828 [Rhizophagus irregularis DAOM 181602=DAOM 197198]